MVNTLGSGHLQYLGGVLVIVIFGVLILLWTKIGLPPELIFHGNRKARIALGIACIALALLAVIDLLLNWGRVSGMGRIHSHF